MLGQFSRKQNSSASINEPIEAMVRHYFGVGVEDEEGKLNGLMLFGSACQFKDDFREEGSNLCGQPRVGRSFLYEWE